MNYTEANKKFDALEYFDKQIQNILLAEGRVFTTKARFNEFEAVKAKGEAPEGYPYKTEETSYCGTLITNKTNDWDEAKEIAIKRGWNETVDGVLCDIIPWDETGNAYTPINNN